MDRYDDGAVQLGESIDAITKEPAPDARPQVEIIAGDELVEAARATPYLARLRDVAAAIDAEGPLPAHVALRRWADVAPTGRITAYDPAAVACAGLGAALDAGLLDADETGVVRATHKTPEVFDHPLAAWGESMLPCLAADPIAMVEPTPRWHDLAMRLVPLLVYQYLVKAGRRVPLAPVADALHREALTAASHHPGLVPVPSKARLARQLGVILTLQVEHGLVDWDPGAGDDDVGHAAPSGLGLFGWLIWVAHFEDDLPPLLASTIEEAGYLPAAGGFVHRDDIGVPVAFN